MKKRKQVYSRKQMEYINSVDGRAHQSAVDIIDELDRVIKQQDCHINNLEDKIDRLCRENYQLIGSLRSCYNSAKPFLPELEQE